MERQNKTRDLTTLQNPKGTKRKKHDEGRKYFQKQGAGLSGFYRASFSKT